jgi:transposase
MHLMLRLIDSPGQAVLDGLEEAQMLTKTLISRSQDVLTYFDHSGTSNGPRQAINRHLESYATLSSAGSTLNQCSEFRLHSKAEVLSVISRHLDPSFLIQSIHLIGFI